MALAVHAVVPGRLAGFQAAQQRTTRARRRRGPDTTTTTTTTTTHVAMTRSARTQRNVDSVRARGFFNIFKQGDGAKDDGGEDPDPSFTWSNDVSVDEVVIMQWTDENDPSGKEYNIVYRNGGPVDAAAVEVLCDKINWPRRPQDKLDKALRNSFLVAAVTLEEPGCAPEARRLIGTARCTSDGAFNATIWDLIVDPQFQGLGLGKALMELLVRSLLKRDISNITLYADAGVVSFYKRLGFDVDPEGIKGMFFKFGA